MQSSTLVYVLATAFLVILELEKVDCRMTMAQIRKATQGPSKKCAAKAGVTKEMVDSPYEGTLPQEEAFGCYLACIIVAMKGADKSGLVSKEHSLKQVKALLPLDRVDKVVYLTETCAPQVETIMEPCERAFAFVKCCFAIHPELYMF